MPRMVDAADCVPAGVVRAMRQNRSLTSLTLPGVLFRGQREHVQKITEPVREH